MTLNNYNPNGFKNLKRVRGIVRFPIVGSGGGGMLDFLGGGMLGISVLGVFVFIVISTFFLLFLNPSMTTGGEPVSAPPPPPSNEGSAITVIPTCANVDQLLLSYFGVKIKPVTESVSCEVRKKIFKIYTIPTQSSTYFKLLNPSRPFTLSFNSGTYGKTSGETTTGYEIKLWGFASFISNDSFFKQGSFFLIHETGHLIRHRHSWITNEYPDLSLISSDPNCYQAGYLKTYSRKGKNKLSENIAESSALYVYNSKTGTYGAISNFRTECDATYAWMKKNFYGDTIIKP